MNNLQFYLLLSHISHILLLDNINTIDWLQRVVQLRNSAGDTADKYFSKEIMLKFIKEAKEYALAQGLLFFICSSLKLVHPNKHALLHNNNNFSS